MLLNYKQTLYLFLTASLLRVTQVRMCGRLIAFNISANLRILVMMDMLRNLIGAINF